MMEERPLESKHEAVNPTTSRDDARLRDATEQRQTEPTAGFEDKPLESTLPGSIEPVNPPDGATKGRLVEPKVGLSAADRSAEASNESEKKLIEALREFVKAQQSAKPSARQKLKFIDGAWLLMGFASIMLFLELMPDLFFKSEAGKLVLDRVLPWFLNLGALAAILKSPDTVLEAARNPHFRWTVPVVFVFLFVITRDLFTLNPVKPDYATVTLEGKPLPRKVKLGRYYVHVDAANAQKPRDFELGFSDFLHGLTLRPRWMVAYKVSFEVPGEMTVCFEPRGFELDEQWVADNGVAFKRLGTKALEIYQDKEGGVDIYLLGGAYTVTEVRPGCGTKQVSLSVPTAGRYSEELTKLNDPIECSKNAAPVVNPCDRYFEEAQNSKEGTK